MRGSRSKLFMKAARKLAESEGITLNKAYIVINHKPRVIDTGEKGEEGQPTYKHIPRQQVKLDRCVRAFYQGLKGTYHAATT